MKIIYSILILFFTTQFVFAQSNRFSFEKYGNNEGDTLNYRLLSPDYNTSRKFPLVIFLHGSGERGHDNEAQLKWGVMNFASDQMMLQHPCYVIAPQLPENESWSNFTKPDAENLMMLNSSPSITMKLLIDLIHDFAAKHPIDQSRIYITGLSMGGFGTFDAIERYPNLFAAAVPVCGGGDISKASLIANIPIWMFHGAEDPAVPTKYSLQMTEALFKAGAHPALTIYPETGHFSWLGAYTDPLMFNWLFSQRIK
ncbi:MAG: prolyl oligopeptidase family serine peptidase [Bacteroidetes bacterium]|nr:prolyl oligopeptidase family serine peptidase [Bacteroidota bacterium]MBU1371916.1 prolyl oligopeptidase family serine peptidase [Bacteroidota bacterium]MBU1483518.1 prolyl oligopeptidase family serine peptidase [Bacteroidota bacterium]MBU1761046.1 prolyl oligopeptidase family serine peptidase [Bacteroidota bacterium]MBU2045694.1 prolyl oligopeptidase family serine peptidase [Bacteroidota bacterium]